MIPNTSVSPAASRNSRRPNCRPLRHCSRKRSMAVVRLVRRRVATAQNVARPADRWRTTAKYIGANRENFAALPLVSLCAVQFSPLHRALVVELVLAVPHDGGDGLEREIALGVLDHILQIEILDREVIVAVFVGAAHRGVVGLAHF